MIYLIQACVNKYPTAPLNGCVNDGDNFLKYINSLGKPVEVIQLYDAYATADNIRKAFEKVKAKAKRWDLVIHQFSGHGVEIPVDKKFHQLVCPVNFSWDDMKTFITDTNYAEMWKGFNIGVQKLWVSDSCHSGGLSTRNLVAGKEQKSRSMPIPTEVMKDIIENISIGTERVKPYDFDGVLITGCQDKQTSADAYINDSYQGAFTWALLNVLKENDRLTLKNVRAKTNALLLSSSFTQTPNLEGNKKMFDYTLKSLIA
jgi:hypothetical protein